MILHKDVPLKKNQENVSMQNPRDPSKKGLTLQPPTPHFTYVPRRVKLIHNTNILTNHPSYVQI